MIHFHSIPKDIELAKTWRAALSGHECSSSPYICINHFTPNDYFVYNHGTRFVLKPGVIPSVFDVFLIEVNENGEIQNEILNEKTPEINETMTFQLQNIKLSKEIEALKSKIAKEKIITDSRILRLNKIKLDQSKKIQNLQKWLYKYQQKCLILNGLNVNIFILFLHLFVNIRKEN